MNCRVEDTAVLHEGTAVTKRTSFFGQEAVHSDSFVITKHKACSAISLTDITFIQDSVLAGT
jgi:hypothetical protein